jgi:hypothetical protein
MKPTSSTGWRENLKMQLQIEGSRRDQCLAVAVATLTGTPLPVVVNWGEKTFGKPFAEKASKFESALDLMKHFDPKLESVCCRLSTKLSHDLFTKKLQTQLTQHFQGRGILSCTVNYGRGTRGWHAVAFEAGQIYDPMADQVPQALDAWVKKSHASDYVIFKETEQKGRGVSCGFEHCCYNFTPGATGNCIGQTDDPLECFVDVEDMKETPGSEIPEFNCAPVGSEE